MRYRTIEDYFADGKKIITSETIQKFDFLDAESGAIIDNLFKLDEKDRILAYDNDADIQTMIDLTLVKNSKLLTTEMTALAMNIPLNYISKLTKTRTGTETTDNTGTQTNLSSYGRIDTHTPAETTTERTPAGETTTRTPAEETTTTTLAGETTAEQGKETTTTTHKTKIPVDASSDFVEETQDEAVVEPDEKATVKTYDNDEVVKVEYENDESIVKTYQGNETTEFTVDNPETNQASGSDTMTRTDALKALLTLNTTEIETMENPAETAALIEKLFALYEENIIEKIFSLLREAILLPVWQTRWFDL